LAEDLSHREINVNLGESGAYTDAVERFMASLDPTLKQTLSTQIAE
jgi:arylformamidase